MKTGTQREPQVPFKFILVGDSGTRKTTFMERHLTGKFKKYVVTLGVEAHPCVHTNRGPIKFNVSLEIQIWSFCHACSCPTPHEVVMDSALAAQYTHDLEVAQMTALQDEDDDLVGVAGLDLGVSNPAAVCIELMLSMVDLKEAGTSLNHSSPLFPTQMPHAVVSRRETGMAETSDVDDPWAGALHLVHVHPGHAKRGEHLFLYSAAKLVPGWMEKAPSH
ncbi:hypothetical protein A6R68_07351, partial [Neotoma lepida]